MIRNRRINWAPPQMFHNESAMTNEGFLVFPIQAVDVIN